MKKLLAIVLMLAMVFTFAACGAQDEGSVATDGDTIKIGVVLPFSGSSEYVGNAQFYGYQYALADYMEHYGDQLNGKTIEFVTADSQGVPDTGVSELERLINEEGVSAVIGTYNSGVAAAMAPVAIKYQVPFMVTNAVADSILSQDSIYLYRSNMGDVDAAPSYRNFITYLNEEEGAGIENVAIIYEATDYGQGARDNLVNNVYGQLGINVCLDESIIADSGDMSTVINKLKTSGADAVCVAVLEKDALLFTRQMKEYNVDIPVIAYGGGFITDSYIPQAGDASEDIIASASYLWDEAAMSEEALAIAADYVANTDYTQVTEPFANGWLGMYALLEAIGSTGGSADREEIAQACDTFVAAADDRALLFHPTIPGIKYEDDGIRYNQNLMAGMQFGQIQGGKFSLIYPAEAARVELVWPAK